MTWWPWDIEEDGSWGEGSKNSTCLYDCYGLFLESKKKTLAIEHYIFIVTVCNNYDCFLSIKAGLQNQLGTHFHLELSRMKTLVNAFVVLVAILAMVEAKPKVCEDFY